MSGAKWLLDTNVVIGLLKKQLAAIALAEAQHLNLNQTAVSQITRMELLGFPNLTDDEESAISEFLHNCHVLLVDERATALGHVFRFAFGVVKKGRCKTRDVTPAFRCDPGLSVTPAFCRPFVLPVPMR